MSFAQQVLRGEGDASAVAVQHFGEFHHAVLF